MKKIVQRLVFLVLTMFILFALHTLRSVLLEERSAALRLQELKKYAEQTEERNDVLRERLSEQGGQRELERIGREQLFLVYPDEKIMITNGN